ncbi:MAG: UDP-N-acetylmuramoyl-tripeptide--D-alanyl-D-alanine ligase [Bacteroidales bacterium]|nr:UDP-N-acetylmuramoyl-tripeptide--D-alanyl-D-alanine ligase [Bacteroidales bacterium]
MEKNDIEKLRQLVLKGHAICTDSRQTKPGDIFFALKGENFNGNKFALQALENGCALAVVDEPIALGNKKLIQVDNVLRTLQQLSHFHRQQFNLPLIGITGTNGKTTTKELTHAVLASTFRTLATKGNLNNHIGVPLTLLDLTAAHEIAIIEMGANHMGEIGELSLLANPGYGLITNIGKAHLEGFGSVENIIKTKTELYDHVKKAGGQIFVNGENSLLTEKAQGAELITYGKGSQNHCAGAITREKPFMEIDFMVNKPLGKALAGTKGSIQTRLVGAFNFENVMAALTIGLYFGVSPDNAVEAIEAYQPSNSRSQLIDNGRNVILLDAYNANPTSMAAAIGNFAGFGQSPRALILGDMLELGETSLEEHRQIIKLITENHFDLSILVGPEFMAVAQPGENCLVFEHSFQATEWLKAKNLEGYHFLVKGSRGIKMEKVLEAL